MSSLIVQSTSGAAVSIKAAALEQLAGGLRGDLIDASHSDYDSVRRVFNAMIDKRPALIVRCLGTADVVHAVEFARSRDLLTAVRGGGHSVGGKSVCDGGMLIDLSPMKGIHVDPHRKVARAQPGLRLRDFDCETQAFGLATTLGVASDTGIAGLTLGGGIGFLNGRCGLACDNLLEAEVVTADGRLVTASAEHNEDLYWALRGGGGNFGIVTSFEYRLHPVGPVLGGTVTYPLKLARQVLRFYDEFSRTAPDDLSTVAAFLPCPDGEPLVGITVCYSGAIEDGERVLTPLRRFAEPVADDIASIPYLDMQRLLDGAFPAGRHHYWKSNFLRAPLSDEAIDTYVAFAEARPSPLTPVVLQQMHGTAARVDASATAFPYRYEQYDMLLLAQWENPTDAEKNIAWTREFWQSMKPFAQGVYVNNLGDEPDDVVREAFGVNYDRLRAIKGRYDPTNFFRLNQNIAPVV